MKQLLIIEMLKLFLAGLNSDEFKQIMDSILDQLEGDNNIRQKPWHKMLRLMLNIEDND